MSTDKASALEQWRIAHREAAIVINSLEHSPYTNKIMWAGANKLLAVLDSIMRGMLT